MCAQCDLSGKDAGFACPDVAAVQAVTGDGEIVIAAPSVGDGEPLGQSPGSAGDTVPGATSTIFTLSNDAVARGYINSSGDQDWYRITLAAGSTYTFAENGFGTGALRDTFVRLYNSSGTLVASDDDSGPLLGSLLRYTAPTTGTYYVSAGAYGSGTGQYLLTMNDATTPYLPVVAVADIAGFNGGEGDRIDLTALVLSGYAAVSAVAQDSGADVVVQFAAAQAITLVGLHAADLQGGWFLL